MYKYSKVSSGLLKPVVGAIITCLSALTPSWATQDLGEADLENFIEGATIMAAGGGGSPAVARKLLEKVFMPSDTVVLSDVSDVSNVTSPAATIGAIGSPEALLNLEDPISLPLNVFVGMESYYSLIPKLPEGIAWLMPIEVGAVNGIYPFLLANAVNKSGQHDPVGVLNADGGGRSVPTLPLLIYASYGNDSIYDQRAIVTSQYSKVSLSPEQSPTEWAIITSDNGDQLRTENTILALLTGKDSPYSGVAGYGSFFVESASRIKDAPPVTGQISLAVKLGAAWKQSPTGIAIVETLNSGGRVARSVFSGTITDVTEDTSGLDFGVVTVTGTGDDAGDTFTIQYQNENICAYKSSYSTTTPFVLGPDSIAYVPKDIIFDNSDLYAMFKNGEKPEVTIVAIDTVAAVKGNANLMQAWAAVRSGIPQGVCDFPYAQPWKS